MQMHLFLLFTLDVILCCFNLVNSRKNADSYVATRDLGII